MKSEIKKIEPEILINHHIVELAKKSGIVCPECGNGSGDDGTGMIPTEYNGAPSYYCHKCGTHFDNFDLIARHFGLNVQTQFPQVLTEGATLLGSSVDFADFKHYHKNSAKTFNKRREEKSEQPPVDHSQFLQVARNGLINLPSNDWRGLMPKTLTHFGCGFAVNWSHPDIKNAPTSDRLIIPTSNYHYLARAINSSVPKEFAKQHVGHKEIFNPDALQNGATVIIVEGEVDCMSIWQATEGEIPCIAVSGCSNYKLLLKWLEQNPDCDCRFIVLFDNDSKSDAGQKSAKKFVDELIKKGVPAVNKILSLKQDFDANDWLRENPADPAELRDRILEIYIQGSDELDSIEEKIKADAAFQSEIADWEDFNGKIKPSTLESVKTARETLLALTADTFMPTDLNSSAFRRQLGLCEFYNFAADGLEKFWDVFNESECTPT